MQQGTFPALNDRQSFAALLGSEGVVDATTGAGDLRVTERAAGANMSVDVSSGRGWVLGDSAAFQGYYVVANDATVNLAVAASDATNPRKDIVIANARDGFYGGTDNDWKLQVVTGSPAASPTEPALPDTALKLAVVDVAAGATSITNANITDTRTQAGTEPGLREASVVRSLTNSDTVATGDRTVSTNLAIPSDWGSYFLYMKITVRYLNTAGASRNVESKPQRGATVLQGSWLTKMQAAGASNIDFTTETFVYEATGETADIGATSDLKWVLTTSGTGVDSQYIRAIAVVKRLT